MKKMKSKLKRRIFAILAAILLVSVFIGISSWIYRKRDYTAHFQMHKGKLTGFDLTPIERRSGSMLYDIKIANDRSLIVTGSLSVPITGEGTYPALVLLGGLRTGKHVLDYVGDMEGAVLLALDYPYEGKKSRMGAWEFLWKLPAMRRAVMNTVPAVLLAVDYLFSRDDVDPDRITLVGGSVGALFAPAVAASDERITAVAILFGAGDLSSLIAANIDMHAPFPTIGAWIGGTLAAPLEPLKYVDRIAPRPLFLLNGTDDPRMPERCSLLLQEKAKNPKTIHWIQAGHIHIRSNEFQLQVRALLEEWLIKNRLIQADSTGYSIRSEED